MPTFTYTLAVGTDPVKAGAILRHATSIYSEPDGVLERIGQLHPVLTKQMTIEQYEDYFQAWYKREDASLQRDLGHMRTLVESNRSSLLELSQCAVGADWPELVVQFRLSVVAPSVSWIGTDPSAIDIAVDDEVESRLAIALHELTHLLVEKKLHDARFNDLERVDKHVVGEVVNAALLSRVQHPLAQAAVGGHDEFESQIRRLAAMGGTAEDVFSAAIDIVAKSADRIAA